MSKIWRDATGERHARREANKRKRRAAKARGISMTSRERPSAIWDHNGGRMEGR